MGSESTYVPKKKWWIVAVAVPVAVALIAVLPSLCKPSTNSAKPQTLIIRGSQFNGDVAYNSLKMISVQARKAHGKELSPELIESLRQAMGYLEAKRFDQAIPLLQVVVEQAPVPAALNNLGVAYLGVGNREGARTVFQRAITNDSNEISARVNLAKLRGPTQETEFPGLEAEITRFDTRGGMITLEVTFRNSDSNFVSISLSPSDAYLLDESIPQKWEPAESSSRVSGRAGAGVPGHGHLITWAKFQITNNVPSHFTVVYPRVPRPFERLTLAK